MAATVSAINTLFFASKEARVQQGLLKTMVEKALDKQGRTELEAIIYGFPGEGNKQISTEQYQRLVGFLRETAVHEAEGELVYLNMMTEKTPIRATVTGDEAVYRYCEDDRLPDDATFTLKKMVTMTSIVESEGKRRKENVKALVEDMELGYRVNLKQEEAVSPLDERVREIRRTWDRDMKTYRVIQRESFQMGPFTIDCSRVRQSRGRTLEESRVLDAPAHHEVEVELKNDRVTEGINATEVLRKMLIVILRVLRVLRGSWFLIRNQEMAETVKEYADFTGQLVKEGRPPQFIGPLPVTLERQMLRDIRLGGYTITRKADGERALMMIGSNGRTRFIYRTMRVEDTGLEVLEESARRTILDGEVITRTHEGKPIHPPMYLVFDCYMAGGKVVSNLPLIRREGEGTGSGAGEVESEVGEGAGAEGEGRTRGKSRLEIADDVIRAISTPGSFGAVWGDERHMVSVSLKPFVVVPRATPDEVERIVSSLMDDPVPYGTDGVIFTPIESGVNNYMGDKLFEIRGTWSDVMKWKPPADNTVDFLLKIKESDEKQARFREGDLFVIGNLLTDEKLYALQEMGDRDFREEMRELENQVVPFQGGVSRIQLETSANGEILARSGEAVITDTIVECAWDPSLPSYLDEQAGGWVVRNIRWDKTALYRQGKIYGTMNTERTAKSVWETAVKDPIALEDLWTSKEIYTDDADGGGEQTREGYFNRRGAREQSLLARMVDFHNLVVKRTLLVPTIRRDKGVSPATEGNLLVDIACGKGGDIPRFMRSGARFILGLDVEPDNILNRDDGAIVRYLNHRLRATERRGRRAVGMRFALADCGRDLYASETGMDEHSREVLKKMLRSGGLMASGVDRVTCMFAVHYFFRDETTISTFFQNISRLLKPRKDSRTLPCFVACCFDGDKVVRMLEAEGGDDLKVSHYEDGKMAWSIQGGYNRDEVGRGDRPVRGLGHEVSVYIETINNTHVEFLVGDEELYARAEEAGLRAPTMEEANALGYFAPAGTFEELFDKTSPDGTGKARDMLPYEKKLSFLYRWFILVPAGGEQV